VRITRLYHPEGLQCGQTIELDADTSNHLIRVLRTRTESPVVLFNGDGFDYYCKTLNSNARKTLISIESKTEVSRESNLNITLIQGLSRQDRMEYTIQKSVELGVNMIIPAICRRSNIKPAKDKQMKKLAHWRKVAISACEQSGRNIIPEVTEAVTLDNINVRLNKNSLKLVLSPDTKTSLRDISFNRPATAIKYIEVIIGPEGGLTEDEIVLLTNSQFNNISFGPRILRTETAGPAVISALQMLWGDY
jgi:16S rRNA (uracil1498-N3)-methyltransferase